MTSHTSHLPHHTLHLTLYTFTLFVTRSRHTLYFTLDTYTLHFTLYALHFAFSHFHITLYTLHVTLSHFTLCSFDSIQPGGLREAIKPGQLATESVRRIIPKFIPNWSRKQSPNKYFKVKIIQRSSQIDLNIILN